VWNEFLHLFGIRLRMSIDSHPQMDGQTECLSQTIEAYLCLYTNHKQNNWVSLLPMAEFAYNNSVTNGIGLSPFYANYRFHPNTTDCDTWVVGVQWQWSRDKVSQVLYSF